MEDLPTHDPDLRPDRSRFHSLHPLPLPRGSPSLPKKSEEIAEADGSSDDSEKPNGYFTEDKKQKGDLVFFKTVESRISHVGVYIGNNQFIHSVSDGPNTGVIVSSLKE